MFINQSTNDSCVSSLCTKLSYLDRETSLILKSIAGKPSHLLTKVTLSFHLWMYWVSPSGFLTPLCMPAWFICICFSFIMCIGVKTRRSSSNEIKCCIIPLTLFLIPQCFWLIHRTSRVMLIPRLSQSITILKAIRSIRIDGWRSDVHGYFTSPTMFVLFRNKTWMYSPLLTQTLNFCIVDVVIMHYNLGPVYTKSDNQHNW